MYYRDKTVGDMIEQKELARMGVYTGTLSNQIGFQQEAQRQKDAKEFEAISRKLFRLDQKIEVGQLVFEAPVQASEPEPLEVRLVGYAIWLFSEAVS